MKRAFVVPGMAYLSAQLLSAICGMTAATAFALFSALLLILYLTVVKKRNRMVIAALLCAAVACGVYSLNYAATVLPAQVLEGREVTLSGRVVDIPESSRGRYYYVIETDSIDLHDAPQRVRVRLSSAKELEAEIADTIKTAALFANISERELPERLRLLSDGVVITASLPFGAEPEVGEGEGLLRIRRWFAELRRSACEAVGGCFPDETAAVLCGMLTGDRSGMTDDMLEWFRLCGTSHLLAVSGLHLSVVIFLLHTLLAQVRWLGRYTRLVLEAAAVLWCMAFIGFTPSITRAGLMLLLSYGARLLQRDTDALNSLCVAVLVMCAVNPFAAADVGLLLSFLATLGLLLVSRPLLRLIKKRVPLCRRGFGELLAGALVSSLSASVFTLPVLVLCFGEVSLISPLANVLFMLPAMALLTVGTLTVFLWQIPVVGQAVCFLPRLLLILLTRGWLRLASLLASLPNAGVPMGYEFMPVFFLCAAALLGAWYFLWRSDRRRRNAMLLCAALILQLFLLGLSWNRLLRGREQYISVYAVENGVLIAACSEGRCVVVGAGGEGYESSVALRSIKESGFTQAEALVLPATDRYDAACVEDAAKLLSPKVIFADRQGEKAHTARYAAEQSGAMLCEVRSAHYLQPASELEVSVFEGGSGARWTLLRCGELRLLVCPAGGDCAELPEQFLCPDCAVVTSEGLVNIGMLDAVALILSDDGESCVRAENRLRYRGAENVYSTGVDGSLRIHKESDMVMIGGAH